MTTAAEFVRGIRNSGPAIFGRVETAVLPKIAGPELHDDRRPYASPGNPRWQGAVLDFQQITQMTHHVICVSSVLLGVSSVLCSGTGECVICTFRRLYRTFASNCLL